MLIMQVHLREFQKEKALKKHKKLLEEQFRGPSQHDIDEEAYDFDGMDKVEREQLLATMKNSRKSTQTNEVRRRFSVLTLTLAQKTWVLNITLEGVITIQFSEE